MNCEQFTNFMLELVQKLEGINTTDNREEIVAGFEQAFKYFDRDENGVLDREELATCVSMLCGGSVDDKIFAAFIMFDVNNIMQLNFQELCKMIKCTFNIYKAVKSDNEASICSSLKYREILVSATR